MYDVLARSVLLDEEPERVARELERLRDRYPRLSREELARKLIRRSALRSAGVGAVASAPAGFLAGLPVAADFSYQVLAMNRLARSIALSLKRETSPAERALAAVAAIGVAAGAEWLRGRAVSAARRALWRRAPRLAPVAGAAIGAGLASLAVYALGRASLDYCRSTSAPRSRRRK